MLVDSRGNPLSSSSSSGFTSGPMLGPVRFEEQPKWVRKMGRKQLAGRTKAQRIRKKAWWAKSAGRDYDVPRWATKSAERRRTRRGAGGRRRRARSSWSYAAPSYSRKRKSKRSRSSYRTTSRRTKRYAGGRRSKRGLTRKEIRRQNRSTWRARKSTRRSRKSSSRGTSRRGTRSKARRGGARVTYSQIMGRLRGTRSKAWVCAGPRRTGCGGGRKGRRGSRVIGILRG